MVSKKSILFVRYFSNLAEIVMFDKCLSVYRSGADVTVYAIGDVSEVIFSIILYGYCSNKLH